MVVQILNFQTQNIIFFILLALAVFLTVRQRKDNRAMSIDSTTELKGLAILSIVLAHIGFGVASNNQFLFPLSTWGGVGVNVFFFLSGFGLTLSALKKDLTIRQFYQKRLVKIMIPLWVFLLLFLILDKLVLGVSYPVSTMVKAFFGFFPRADLATDINSPLWFMTPLIFYYLVFPIIFIKKWPEIPAFLLAVFGYIILQFNLPIGIWVKALWSLHYLAFPLGILFASILVRTKNLKYLHSLQNQFNDKKFLVKLLKYFVLLLLFIVWLWLFKYSGVGESKLSEQLLSLLALLVTVFIFIIKPVESRFLLWLGIFSYEIYLFHWPLLYRYDFIFKFLPASVAVFVYLVLFVLLGWGINIVKDVMRWKTLHH